MPLLPPGLATVGPCLPALPIPLVRCSLLIPSPSRQTMDWKKQIKFQEHEKKALKLGAVMVDLKLGENKWLFGKIITRYQISIKLLKRGQLLDPDGGKPFWVYFRFERLPNFCYICGILDHAIRDRRKRTNTAAQNGVPITTGVSPPLKKTNVSDGLGLAGTAAQSRPPQ